MLQVLTAYPKVTVIGVEIDAATANEAQRLASLLGMTQRVKILTKWT